MTKLALFGAGRIGQVHARNLMAMQDMKLVAIADPVPSPGREDLLARSQARLSDAEAVFADPEIDAYLIASPTDTHEWLLRQAARTGKPVFCEKPVSLDFRKVIDIAREIGSAGNAVMLGFQRRYDPDFLHVKEEIASGRSGKVQHIVMHTRDPSPPPVSYVKSSGGLFRDQAIHDFDMTRYLLGEEIVSVSATGACLIDPAIGEAGDIDTAMITLRSESGRLVQMINARHAAFGYDQRLEAVCEKRVFYVANQPATNFISADIQGFTSSRPMSDFIARFAEAYRAEMDAFRALIQQGKPPLATMRDGVEAQRLAEAATLSLELSRPVAVSMVD
ncbi:inositol 2-dehydrogenase [Asaia prunellae]|uniref:inositol 2-dehydrogenase n=1 Tax=Asaia prunellae TaxID=610245 RepID=UPI000472681B|nr:inositol 2-dehydrogenase [Asaia prunellae]